MKRAAPAKARFTALLGILVVALMLLPLLPIGSALRFCLEGLVLLAAAFVVWRLEPARSVIVLIAVTGVVAVAGSAARLVGPAPVWVVIDHVGAVSFVLLVAFSITRNVWREQVVSADTIVGGITVYILLGVAWSLAYQLLEFLVPGSLVVVSPAAGHWGPWELAPGQYPRLLFFSFVTLTTLGYGDVVPGSPAAGALAAAEAVVGPLYLTVLIARLVGLHIAGVRAQSEQEKR